MARLVSTPAAVAVVVAVLLAASPAALAVHDYGDALHKSILFFEGQRSGRLPPTSASGGARTRASTTAPRPAYGHHSLPLFLSSQCQ